MSEENTAQEKTEQPTQKRLQDAKQKGQVAQSKDLNTFLILAAGSGGILIFGSRVIHGITDIMEQSFNVKPEQLSDDNLIPMMINTVLWIAINAVFPLLLILFLAAFIGPLILNGGKFNFNTIKFKAEKLSLFKGLKRLFAVRGLVEMVKSLLKFIIIAVCAYLILWSQFDKIMSLTYQSILPSMLQSISILAWSFLGLSCSLIIIVSVDVPYQLWEHVRQLRMSKQDIRDEYKQTEGKPEVKSHIRKMQQELSRQRMMDAVPDADVIITNPTHYAVALRYEKEGNTAPRVVARGKDLIALQIRTLAKEHNVSVVEIPPLARAIFHSTKINHEIPRGLYVAVAHVLAYVYQLKNYKKYGGQKPKVIKEVPMPDDFSKYNAE